VISEEKAQIQGYVFRDIKVAAQEVAAAQGLSLSSWMQVVIIEAIDEYQAKQARKAAEARKMAAANYDGVALL